MSAARVRVGCIIVVAFLATASPTAATNSPLRRATTFQTSRSFRLGAGRATRTFTLHERSGVILLNRVTAPAGARVVVTTTIAHVAGVRVMSWEKRPAPSPACRRSAGFVVCTQGEEGCPMPQATWQVRLVKMSGPAGRVRFDFLVAPPSASSSNA